jgi:hypothetical protein
MMVRASRGSAGSEMKAGEEGRFPEGYVFGSVRVRSGRDSVGERAGRRGVGLRDAV